MQVVFLSAEYPPAEGGVGDYTRRLALALCKEEVGVAVLTGTSQGSPVQAAGRLTSAGTVGFPGDPMSVHALVGDWGWACLPASGRFLRRYRPHVLHLQYQTGAYRMHPAIHFLPDLLRRLPSPPRLVVTMHDLRLPYLFPKAGRLRHFLVARMLRLAEAVVVTNGADLMRLGGEIEPGGQAQEGRPQGGRPQGLPLRRRGKKPVQKDRDLLRPLPPGLLARPPTLIPLGSSLPADLPGYERAPWRSRLGIRPGEALLGHFGLLHPSKGVDVLVEALAHLPGKGLSLFDGGGLAVSAGAPSEAGRPVRLLIVGGGTGSSDPGNVAFQAALDARIAELGLAEAVLRTGPCPAEEAAGHLRACDIVVLPYRDGASFRRSSLVAALSLGCPVVTTVPLSLAEVSLGPGQPTLGDGRNVALVPAGEVAALAEAIAGLLKDEDRRRRLGEGAGRLGQAFRWEQVGRRHRTLYGELAGRPGPGKPRDK